MMESHIWPFCCVTFTIDPLEDGSQEVHKSLVSDTGRYEGLKRVPEPKTGDLAQA